MIPSGRNSTSSQRTAAREKVNWLTELPPQNEDENSEQYSSAEFREGRLAVTMSADLFLDKDVQALAGSESWDWVELLTLEGVNDSQLDAVARSPLLAGVLSLSFEVEFANDSPLGDGLAVTSPRTQEVANLRDLNLCNNGIGPDGARALAASAFLRNLTGIDLAANDLGDEGVEKLVATGNMPDLRRLELAIQLR